MDRRSAAAAAASAAAAAATSAAATAERIDSLVEVVVHVGERLEYLHQLPALLIPPTAEEAPRVVFREQVVTRCRRVKVVVASRHDEMWLGGRGGLVMV